MIYHIPVPDDRIGLELDEFLCLVFPLLSKGWVRSQVRAGRVLVDGSPAHPSQRLRSFQVLSVDFDEEEAPPGPPVAPPLQVAVLFEDEDVLVVDKPAGLAVEPERWERGRACVAGALLELALERSGVETRQSSRPTGGLGFRPRIVHRIDKDTSGVLVVAKTLEAERSLREAFAARRVSKRYLALVEGEHPLADGEEEQIDLPIAPDRRRSGRMVVDDRGKEASTRLRVVQRFRGYTLLECAPKTGRTHQIRVHLAARGFPLAIDPVYGRKDEIRLSALKRGYKPKRGAVERPLMDRLTLHAHSVRFEADVLGREIAVESAPPKDFARVLKQLEKVRPFRRAEGRQ